jgi:2-haloacid dehalogenase
MKPTVVVFDVNETLSDLSALGPRFGEVGADPGLLQPWFAGVLRDGFALTVTRRTAPFREVAAGTLRAVLAGAGISDVQAVDHVLDGFAELPLHPDVADGVSALRRIGLRLVTLSNGAVDVAESLLRAAGLRSEFEAVLSVADAGRWKPDRVAYEYALRVCGVPAAETLLVAVHPWDIHGGACAGLRTAWLQRGGAPYPGVFAQPEVTATTLPELADELAQLST